MNNLRESVKAILDEKKVEYEEMEGSFVFRKEPFYKEAVEELKKCESELVFSGAYSPEHGVTAMISLKK